MKNNYFYGLLLAICLFTCSLIKAQTDAEKYWIKETFANFTEESDYHQQLFDYETYPNQIPLSVYYANIEKVEGTCGIDTNVSLYHLRIRGLKDNGHASFSVPDAQKVTLFLRGKSHNKDRIIKIYKNDVLLETFNNLDEDTCIVFEDNNSTPDLVTYTITAGDENETKPVVIYGIEVEKFDHTAVADMQRKKLEVYPNPAGNEITINADNNFIINNVEFYDNMGKLVLSHKGNKTYLQQISVEKLPAGIYTINVISDDKNSFTKKIIKL